MRFSIIAAATVTLSTLSLASPVSGSQPSTMSTFTVTANSGTDIWRKPPSTNDFNAPTFVPAGVKSTGPLSKFKSVSVSFAFTPKVLYDQAGVVLSMRPAGSAKDGPPAKWVKSGVEMLDGTPVLGTVATDNWSDWSLSPVPDEAIFLPEGAPGGKQGFSKVVVEKGGDDPKAPTLWVRLVTEEGVKKPLREITWVFDTAIADWELEVAAYVARPQPANDTLTATFQGLDVQWSE
ncbi:hypothetical protein RB595_005713 [Gaeumannomyces hyphopodioides]